MSRIGPKWGYRCSFKDTPASKSYGLRRALLEAVFQAVQ
jgi:hypothetical protein